MLLEHAHVLVPPPAFALPDGAHEAGRKHELVLDVNAPVRRLCIACIACPSPVRPQRRTAGPASGRRVSRDTNTHQDGRVTERAAAAETPGHARGGSLVSSASSLFLAAPGIFSFAQSHLYCICHVVAKVKRVRSNVDNSAAFGRQG